MKKKLHQALEERTEVDKDLFALLGLGGLSKAEQETLLSSLSDIIFQGVFAEAIPLIPADKLEAFTALTSGKADEEEVLSFLESNVPGFSKIVEDEILNLQDTLKRSMPPLTSEESEFLKN